MASAMIDVDNDGIDEVFVGGGLGQEDGLYKYSNGSFVESNHILPVKPQNSSTYGAVSFDLDNDGNTDLFLTTDAGVLWYRNTGTGFEILKIDVPFDEKSIGVSVTFGDINRDGHADMFVSNYIKKDKMEGQTIFKDFAYGGSSLLMLNKGDNTFEDVTERFGLTYVHNTFMAIFVDMDNDGFLDLVAAHDTGEVRTYKNEGGQKYSMKPNPTTRKYAYPMGIAVGDYNNDGNIDFFFSNVGSSVPVFMARGDLAEEDVFIKDWILFRNNGDFTFTDVAKETKVADFEFSWGAIFEDFNLDGRQDLVVAENYVDFPPHKLFKLPGRFLLQRADGTFAAVEDQADVVNKIFGITPLSSDFNQDGYPDLVFPNLNGTVQAHMNKGGDANYIAVRLPENAKFVGARITVTKNDGTTMTDAYVTGEGLVSDQTSTVTFGLGDDTEVRSVSLALSDGTTQSISKPKVNVVNTIE
ncbi:MAG: hypothetical protein ACJA01_003625 [Saprospiraceae bacterium]|jgi:hypothetical protein